VYPAGAVGGAGTLTLSAYNHGVDRTNVFNQTDVIYVASLGGVTHTVLFGLEAGRQYQDELRHTAASIANVPLTNPIRDADFDAAPLVVDRHATSNILAAYAQDQIDISRRFKAVVGARTDRFQVGVNDRLPADADLSRIDVATSPRAGLIYQPSGSAAFYTSYSYTFLPSGQTLGLATNTVQLRPENARNYEAGAKLDWLAGRLNVAAAVFRLDRNNVKNTDPNDPTRLVLTGQQRTDGVSVSAAGNLTPRWKVSAGFAALDARITRSTSAAPAGRTVGLVPRSQVTLWSTYDLSRRWGGGGGLVYQSRTYASFSNQVELPRFARLDAVLYYKIHGYRIGVNADNILDAKYYPTSTGDNNISAGAPRSIRCGLIMSF
jgi:catecholate siderophore receptor